MALSIARIHFGKKKMKASFESKYCRCSTIKKKKWQIMRDNGRTMGRTREFLAACEILNKKSDLLSRLGCSKYGPRYRFHTLGREIIGIQLQCLMCDCWVTKIISQKESSSYSY